MRSLKKVLSIFLVLFSLFPTFASASEVPNITNNFALESDITIIEHKSIGLNAATKEAVVKDTAQQYFMEGKWQGLHNVKYRSLWFTNGVVDLGFTEIARKEGWNYTLYTWKWDYRVY